MELLSLQQIVVDDKQQPAQPEMKNQARFHFSHHQGMKISESPGTFAKPQDQQRV